MESRIPIREGNQFEKIRIDRRLKILVKYKVEMFFFFFLFSPYLDRVFARVDE